MNASLANRRYVWFGRLLFFGFVAAVLAAASATLLGRPSVTGLGKFLCIAAGELAIFVCTFTFPHVGSDVDHRDGAIHTP